MKTKPQNIFYLSWWSIFNSETKLDMKNSLRRNMSIEEFAKNPILLSECYKKYK